MKKILVLAAALLALVSVIPAQAAEVGVINHAEQSVIDHAAAKGKEGFTATRRIHLENYFKTIDLSEANAVRVNGDIDKVVKELKASGLTRAQLDAITTYEQLLAALPADVAARIAADVEDALAVLPGLDVLDALFGSLTVPATGGGTSGAGVLKNTGASFDYGFSLIALVATLGLAAGAGRMATRTSKRA
ncbi:MAG: hypothetical protein LBS41_02640 [Streptococcaceae bacterium]|jgi:hypothetical protein|nr:hypothetical protein [Streptococcaceae bacterium]